jgi:hypothetical protein
VNFSFSKNGEFATEYSFSINFFLKIRNGENSPQKRVSIRLSIFLINSHQLSIYTGRFSNTHLIIIGQPEGYTLVIEFFTN